MYSLEPINPNGTATGPSEYGYMDSGCEPTSQTPAYQYIPVAENSGHCCISSSDSCGKLNNTYSVSAFAIIKIRCNNFNSSGDLNITGVNQMWVTGQQGVTSPTSPINGSKATISLPMVPAYMVSGTVKSTTGSNLCGQKVEIRDKSNGTAYVVNTNKTGEYRFFAKPDCNYTVSLCSYPYYGHCLSASSTNNEGGNTSVNFIIPPYMVNFNESGLASGQCWSVDFNGETLSSTSPTITFGAPNGTYDYSIPSVSGYTYTTSPSGPDVTVSGTDETISVTFTLTSSGGGGGGGCVNATTEILMANFISMQAQYVLPGDYVLAYNLTTHVYQREEVLDAYVSNHPRLYTINGILQTSAYQPILTNNGYIQVQNLTTKDKIYDAFTGKYVKVTSITLTNGNYTMYDFEIPPDYDFIAWEYVLYDITCKDGGCSKM